MKFKFMFFLVLFLSFTLITEASDLKFEFKKSLMPNEYKLVIYNKDDKRTVEFYGCYESATLETNYYAEMKNGSKSYFDSKVFCGIGMKGRYWVNAGSTGAIPFSIKKIIIQNAKNIILKGVTYVPVRTGAFVDLEDIRDLVVNYDVKSGMTSFEIGKEILKQSNFGSIKKVLGQYSTDEHSGRLTIDQMGSGLGHHKVIDAFQLKTKEE